MAEQDTNVRYNAVVRFADLHAEIDSLLAKIKALEKAEKDLNKETDTRRKSSAGRTPDSKAAEASEARRIKRLDARQRAETRANNLALRAEADRLKRVENRTRRELSDIKKIENEEKRSHQAKVRRANRDNARRNAETSSIIKEERALQTERLKIKAAELAKIHAQEKAADAALNNDMLQRSKQFTKQRMREIDLEHAQKLSSIRDVFNEQKKLDRQRAMDLARDLEVSRADLTDANRVAKSGNRYSRRKVQVREAPSMPEFSYDESSSKTYWQQLIAHREREIELTRQSTEAVRKETKERGFLYNLLGKIGTRAEKAAKGLKSTTVGSNRDIKNTNTLLGKLSANLDRIGRWRPRLIPPFIALIPIIGSLLALLNPLVAGLGAVGVAAFAMGSSLVSLAGAALGAIPALASLLSLAGALKLAFGGIGSAFKAAGKLSSGGGGGSAAEKKEELTQVEKIERAQEKYRRSIEDVQLATEDLDEAKRDYIKRLKEVEKQVNRVRLSEARAAANAQLAIEEYYNVMADPASTKGAKMDAFTGMEEAQQELEDVRQEAINLQKELDNMKKTGVEGDDAVRRASRALTDAIWAQRDAQLDLANAYKDTGAAAGGAASAADEFADAMAKLSPSAQAFVMALLAMKPAWEEVQRSVQERFFSEILGDVESLTKLFPVLNRLLGNAAGAFGRVVSESIKLATSDKWLRDLGILGEQNVPIIENIGEGLLSIVDAFMDLAVAAGPFTIAMTEGFRAGSKNFQEMIAGARASGSLAKWLETIGERMSQWWRIVKNVGQTLFNYGAAAAPFGQWLTDGLENVTEGWLKASEASREAGSAFTKYLENIKPLLTSVKNMFSTFFGWFAREASDPKNIAAFTAIIDTLTNELGPAIARIFESLSSTGVQQALVDSISDLADAVATFLESGGSEGFKTFFDTLGTLSKAFAVFVDLLPDDVVAGLAVSLGTIALLRFTGVTTLLTSLVSAFGVGGITKGAQTFFNILKSPGGIATGALATALTLANGVNEQIKKSQSSVTELGATLRSSGSAFETLNTLFGGLEGNIKSFRGGVDGGVAGLEAMTSGMQHAAHSTGSLTADLSMLAANDFWTWSATGFGLLNTGMKNTKERMEDLGRALSNATPQEVQTFFTQLKDELGWTEQEMINLILTSGEFRTVLEGQALAMGISADETNLLMIAQGELSLATMDTTTSMRDLITETLNYNNLGQSVAQTNARYMNELAGVQDHLAKAAAGVEGYSTSLDRNTQQGANNWAMLANLASSSQAAAAAQYELDQETMSGEEAMAAYQARLETGRAELVNVLTQFGLNENAAAQYANEIYKIPTKHELQVVADKAKAQQDLLNYKQSQDNLKTNINTNVTASTWQAENALMGVANSLLNLTGTSWIVDLVQRNRSSGGGYTGGKVSTTGIQRFYKGGKAAVIPGIRSNTDTVPAMLTPGEVIFSKAAVARAGGAQNLLDFNAGKINFGEMLMNSAFSNVQSYYTGGLSSRLPQQNSFTTNENSGGSIDNSITIENITIERASDEPTEESIANVIRDLSHLRG